MYFSGVLIGSGLFALLCLCVPVIGGYLAICSFIIGVVIGSIPAFIADSISERHDWMEEETLRHHMALEDAALDRNMEDEFNEPRTTVYLTQMVYVDARKVSIEKK